MNTIYLKRNLIATIILQIVTLICGFIVPKLLLSTFGSEVYGLTASITQFLSYIQLLEGGLTGVVMASLYKPLSKKDFDTVSGIINATERFFKQIAGIYLAYATLLSIVYPLIIKTDFSYFFVLSLIIIVSVSSFIQYFFALTYRILINADRQGYIVSIANIVFLIINLVLTFIAIKVFPQIHFVKFVNAVAFIVQPVIFSRYIKKHYKIDKRVSPNKDAISQRWAGFGQNLAYFIHSNTDIVILSFFSLKEVSVYSVYIMIIAAIKNLIIAVSSAIIPSMGNVLVSRETIEQNKAFDNYEFLISLITTILFSCCIVLIVPFVGVYTSNINDANYIRPTFAIIMTLAEATYCIRDPFVSVAYASGKFKETAKYAYFEAGLNIAISLILVYRLGILGVAIGTLISMLYRLIAHVLYLKNNILNRNVISFIKNMIPFVMGGILGIFVAKYLIHINVVGYLSWFTYALVAFVIITALVAGVVFILNRKQMIGFINKYVKRANKIV